MGDPEKSGGYESMVWLNDEDGKEFVCYLEDIGGDTRTPRKLSEEEKAKCLNVSEIVGTERWRFIFYHIKKTGPHYEARFFFYAWFFSRRCC